MDGSTTTTSSVSIKENNEKTTLMSRIAKLGQPILPLSGPIVADDSDSEQVVIYSDYLLTYILYAYFFCVGHSFISRTTSRDSADKAEEICSTSDDKVTYSKARGKWFIEFVGAYLTDAIQSDVEQSTSVSYDAISSR